MAASGPVTKSKAPLTVRIAKVFADPLRMKVLAELNNRVMSPKQFFDEFGGGTLTRVWRQFRTLEEYDWVEQVSKKSGGKRRGAVEHFYRATGPAVFDNATWSDIPDSMKEMVSWRIFETLTDQVKEAMEGGTIDARDDRHFTWTPLRLDQQGWDSVIAKVDSLFESLFEEQEEARIRLAESGEEPIPMTVALAAFESPKEAKKAP